MIPNKEDLKSKYGNASDIWTKLDNEKGAGKTEMWRRCASLTLPYLCPPSGHNENTELYYPYNSIGTYATNTLSSKLSSALIPTTGKFFRLLPFDEKIEGLAKEDLQELEKELSQIENNVISLIGIQGLTASLTEAVKLLIVTGNALIHKIKGKSFKVYNPLDYCVERDYAGNIMTIIIKEVIDARILGEEFIDKNRKEQAEEDEIDIYTCIYRLDKNNYILYQEVDDKIIEKTIKAYKTDLMPFIALRWNALHNEDYGRGLVEQHLGDLVSLENLQRIIIEGAASSAKIVYGLKKGATLKAKDLENARNGDVVLGDFGGANPDVTVLQSNKSNDLIVPLQLIQDLKQNIGKAFLMFSSSVRDSERTTMAEIRETTAELDAAFGGTFSVLANELQIPLVRLLLNEINPEVLELTTPSIITTANSVSREKDIQNLQFFLQSIAQFGPDFIQANLKIDSYLKELATAIGIDATKIVKTAQEKQVEQQALMEQQAQLQAQETMPTEQQPQ